MSSRCVRFISYLGLVLAGCTLTGCGGGVSNSRYYMLESVRDAEPQRIENDSMLSVARFTIDSAYANRELVYRLDEFLYDSDGYNEFIVAPAIMVTENTRDWLAASGLFSNVVGLGSGLQPTHRLEGNVTALYGDFRNRKAPKAVMELKVFLLKTGDGADPVPIFGKTYAAITAPDGRDPDDLVSAFSRCLETILTDLEEDLLAAVTTSN